MALNEKPMNVETATAVYQVLIDIAGAAPAHASRFIEHYSSSEKTSHEWRFQGHLGEGGKFRFPHFTVDCYSEDETPKKLLIIERTNAALAQIKSQDFDLQAEAKPVDIREARSTLVSYLDRHAWITKNKVAPERYTDVGFFNVQASPEADAAEFKELVNNCLVQAGLNLFDQNEHSYIEIGGAIGDQGTALQLMGLGVELYLWSLLSPKTMLGVDNDSDMGKKLLGQGMLTIQAKKER